MGEKISDLVDPAQLARLREVAGMPAPVEAKSDEWVDVSETGLEVKAGSVEMEHKADLGGGAQVLETDDSTGRVVALVSVTGVQDRVKDIIEPGAYTKTMATREPIGVWSHDDKTWVARTEHAVELMPGDPFFRDLKTMDGKPWPKEAGAVKVESLFNLETPHGAAAYSDVKFFKGKTGWSIGYRATKAARNMRTGVRHIKELDWFEYSPVMVGAASQPMTLSVKSLAQPVDANDPTGIASEEALEQLTEDDLRRLDELKASLGLETKDIVRTPEGAARFGQPIGTRIVRDTVPASKLKVGDLVDFQGMGPGGPSDPKPVKGNIQAVKTDGDTVTITVDGEDHKLRGSSPIDIQRAEGPTEPHVAEPRRPAPSGPISNGELQRLFGEAKTPDEKNLIRDALKLPEDERRDFLARNRASGGELGKQFDKKPEPADPTPEVAKAKDVGDSAESALQSIHDANASDGGPATMNADLENAMNTAQDLQAGDPVTDEELSQLADQLEAGGKDDAAKEVRGLAGGGGAAAAKPDDGSKPDSGGAAADPKSMTNKELFDASQALAGPSGAGYVHGADAKEKTARINALRDEIRRRTASEEWFKGIDYKPAGDGGGDSSGMNVSERAAFDKLDAAGKRDFLARRDATVANAGKAPEKDKASGGHLKPRDSVSGGGQSDHGKPSGAAGRDPASVSSLSDRQLTAYAVDASDKAPSRRDAFDKAVSDEWDRRDAERQKRRRSDPAVGVGKGGDDGGASDDPRRRGESWSQFAERTRREESARRSGPPKMRDTTVGAGRGGDDGEAARLREQRAERAKARERDMNAAADARVREQAKLAALNKRRRARGQRPLLKLPPEAKGITDLDFLEFAVEDSDEVKAMGHESLNRSPRQNWVERAGQLPAYIQHIAKDISEERGVPLDRAIPIAIGRCKTWARGGGGVKPDTVAKAQKAVAEWEALKAKAHMKFDSELLDELEWKACVELDQIEDALGTLYELDALDFVLGTKAQVGTDEEYLRVDAETGETIGTAVVPDDEPAPAQDDDEVDDIKALLERAAELKAFVAPETT